MFCTIEDMVCRFGYEEMLCLGDKAQPRFGVLNPAITDLTDPNITAVEKRILLAIQDACEEIFFELSCCYDVSAIKEIYDNGGYVLGLKHFCCDIARYHLYDVIQLRTNKNAHDHEAYRRYEDVITHLKKICECGTLAANDFCEIPKKRTNGISVTTNTSCIPEDMCCPCNDGGCC